MFRASQPRLPLFIALIALGLAGALFLAACGSGGNSSSDASGTTSPVEASAPAAGSPITVGVVAAEDEPEVIDAFEATIKYLNKEGGGLLDHKLEVKSCDIDGTPERSIACANEMVSAEAQAVVLGEDRSADSAFPIYEKAGVAVLTGRPVTAQELESPVAISLTPGIPGILADVAGFISHTLKGKDVVTMVPEGLPSAVLDAYVGQPLEAAGLTSNYVFFPTRNPNFSSILAAAEEQEPDVVLEEIDENPLCVPAMRAAKELESTFITFEFGCNEDEVLNAAGSFAEGVYFYGFLDVNMGIESPATELFEYIMNTYSETRSLGYPAATTSSAVMTLANVLEERAKGDQVTSKSILSAFSNSAGLKIFMGPKLTCGQAKAFPSICALDIRVFQFEGGEKNVLTPYFSYPAYVPGQ